MFLVFWNQVDDIFLGVSLAIWWNSISILGGYLILNPVYKLFLRELCVGNVIFKWVDVHLTGFKYYHQRQMIMFPRSYMGSIIAIN